MRGIAFSIALIVLFSPVALAQQYNNSTTYNISNQGATSFTDQETPIGIINNVNTVFTLTRIPLPSTSIQLFLNNVLMLAGIHYSITTNVITYTTAPQTGDNHYAYYRY